VVEPDPAYRLLLTASVRRALAERLPHEVAAAVWEFVSGPLSQRPHQVGAPLRAPYDGLWRVDQVDSGTVPKARVIASQDCRSDGSAGDRWLTRGVS